MFEKLREDALAFKQRDPAARSTLEIVLCYPGYHALVFYRVTSWLWKRNLFLPARFLAAIGRILSGIEIHPGATIGRRFVIDHGTGVVVGETAEIGDDVTLYHDVTLGGIAPSVDSDTQVGIKRHPTIENGAIIGSGAAVLGPITIGEGAKVGANSVVTKDVPAGVTAVGVPARLIMPKDKSVSKDFLAYGTDADCPDPVIQTINDLRRQITMMGDRINELETLVPAQKPKKPKKRGADNDVPKTKAKAGSK